MKQHIIYLLLLMALAVACSDDDQLTPTETPEFGYFVPQGEHDYDDRIVDWQERCNTFILYKFNMKELYWQVNGWYESKPEPEGSYYPFTKGLRGEVADEQYVGEQLDLIESLFLNFYPDTTLNRCLPLKILLCSKLDEYSAYGDLSKTFNVYNGYDYLAFNWGNESVLTFTDVQKNSFRKEVNNVFLTRLLDKAKVIVDPAFYEGMNYERITATDMYSRGFIKAGTKQADDAKYFIEAIISNPYEDLIAENTSTNTYVGILNPVKDVNGLIRKKYEILVNSFKENYGIDLQAIGDAELK